MRLSSAPLIEVEVRRSCRPRRCRRVRFSRLEHHAQLQPGHDAEATEDTAFDDAGPFTGIAELGTLI